MYLKFFSVVAAALSTACITFQEQTLTYRHDTARNVLQVYTTYVGIHGDSVAGDLTSAEEGQLLNAAFGDQIFFFGNWISVLDLDELRSELALPPPSSASTAVRQSVAARRRLWGLLVANTSLSNGPFYTDDAGRLCAAQRMTVTNVGMVLEALNSAWQPWARVEAERDPEWGRAALSIREVLSLDGNRLTISYPGNIHDLDHEIARAWAPTSEGGVIRFVFGDSSAPLVSLNAAVEKQSDTNAIEFTRSAIGIARSFDPRADAARFFGLPDEQGTRPSTPGAPIR